MTVFEFIEAEKANWSVRRLCETFGVTRGGYYAHKTREPSTRDLRRQELTKMVTEVFEESRNTYGSPRIFQQLEKNGEIVSENTVADIMAENGLVARKKRKFKVTTDSRRSVRIAPNLLERNFFAEAPNQVWVTDVTAYWTISGWVYVAAIIDLFSRRIVGLAFSDKNDTELALTALRCAYFMRSVAPGLIHHSDRGSPYASDDYIRCLDEMKMIRSMSKKGDCWDNAVAESFFSTLEFECIQDRTLESRSEIELDVREFVENFYNIRRIHTYNKNLSPAEAEIALYLQKKFA